MNRISPLPGPITESLTPPLLRMVSVINRANDAATLEKAIRVVAEELSTALGASGGGVRIDSGKGDGKLFCEGEAKIASLFCFDHLAPSDCLCGATPEEPEWIATDEKMGGRCRDTGYLSLFAAPVTVEGERVGLFLAGSVLFKEPVAQEARELVTVILGILGEAVTRIRAGEGVARRAAELETVNTIGRLITAKLTLAEMAAEIVERIGQALDTDEVNVILYDDEREELTFLARLGEEGDDDETNRVYPLSDGMNSWIVRNKRPLLIAEDSERECAALGIRHGGRPAKSWLGTPMFYQEKVIGVLSVQRYETPGVYDERSAELLAIVAGQCAVAVENARLFEQALKREREKERIYFSLNHDLLSLVNPVRGFAKLMKSLPPEADRERFGALADSVIASAEKITRFVEDVLIWGKIQSGKLTLNIARVDMVRIARAALHGVTPEMMMRKLTATINGRPYRFDAPDLDDEAPLMADIDAAQMERVFTNLLGNAVKHANTRIDVALTASDGFVTCTVSDDGEGVPSHCVDSLFEEYYQEGRARRGVGLGLPTVKKIIELHHGAILVESDIGAGMTVEFSWPRTLADRTGRSEG